MAYLRRHSDRVLLVDVLILKEIIKSLLSVKRFRAEFQCNIQDCHSQFHTECVLHCTVYDEIMTNAMQLEKIILRIGIICDEQFSTVVKKNVWRFFEHI